MILTLVVLVPRSTHAAFNETINYQGKLIDSSGMAVSNGNQCLKFRLMDSQTPGGNELWSEEWHSSTTYVVTNGGLFSVMLGSHTSLSSLNFNSASLYLEVQYDPGCDGNYEEVFSPRKQFGSVPAAFEAKKMGGYDWASPAAIGAGTPNSGTFTSLSANNGSTVSGGNVSITTDIGQLVFGVTGDVSLYRDSANVLRSDDTLSITANIGIGTTNPGAKLDVRGGINAGTNGTEFVLSNTGTITAGLWQGTTITVGYGGTGATTFAQYGILYGNTTSAISATAAGSSNQVLVATTGAAPSWTNISGIGSQIDHGTLLDLTADDHTQYAFLAGRAGGQTLIGGTAANNVLTIQANSATSGNTATNTAIAMKVGDSGGTTAINILNNGNVGIGTISPNSPLELTGVFRMTDGSSGCMKFDNSRMALVYADDCTNFHYLYYGSGWQDDGSIVRLINTSDSVSIGTTGGTSPLNIYRSGSDVTINFNEGGSSSNWIVGIDQSDSSKFKISNSTTLGSNDYLTIQSNGNIGIGTTNATSDLQITSSGNNTSNLSIINGYSVNIFDAKTLNTNFGMAVNSGAFIDRNSYIGEEFTRYNASTRTQDTAGSVNYNAISGFGDGRGWGVYEANSASFTLLPDTVNGIFRQTVLTANSASMAMLDEGMNNPHLIINSANLPVFLMKVRPSNIASNNQVFVGASNNTDALTTRPNNFVGFTNVNSTTGLGTNTWYGAVTNGGTTSQITCTGQTISTTNFALLMAEVISSTSVRYYVDNDVSDGVSFSYCGEVTTNIPTADLAPQIHYNVPTGGTANTYLDTDFYRVWQDDSINTSAVTSDNLSNNTSSNTTVSSQFSANISLAWLASRPSELSSGTVITIDSESLKANISQTAYDPLAFGVVSNTSSFVLNNETDDTIPIAITGVATVSITNDNGIIYPGDYVTSSSVAGRAMKATKAGSVIGKALTSSKNSEEIQVYLSPSIITGEFETTISHSDLLNQLLSQDTGLSEGLSIDTLSQIHTDSILAERDLIVPTITADEILVNTITNDNSNLILGFNDNNLLTIKSKHTGSTAVTIDDRGNAYFSGDIYANNITASGSGNNSIDSLSNDILSLSSDITDLKNRIDSDNYVTLSNLGIAQNNGALSFSTDILFNGRSVFAAQAEFNDLATFNYDMLINKQIKFGRNIAGISFIKPGETTVTVEFDTPYNGIPYISTNLTLPHDYTEEQKTILKSLILNSSIRYLISDTTQYGFTITINAPQEIDLPFIWQSYLIDESL